MTLIDFKTRAIEKQEDPTQDYKQQVIDLLQEEELNDLIVVARSAEGNLRVISTPATLETMYFMLGQAKDSLLGG
jgi:hypothetical protein